MNFEDNTDSLGQNEDSLTKTNENLVRTSSNQKDDFDVLTENISQGLARCEIICDANNKPIDYRILSANKAFEKHTGLKREICLGKRILEVYPDMEKSWIETYGRVALTRETKTIEGYNHNTKRHYRSKAYSNKIGEFMMLFEDITHQKELEKAYDLVSKSSRLNTDLIENMPYGFKWCSIIKDENNNAIDFKILKTNAMYADQVGLNVEEISGKTFLQLFPNAEKKLIQRLCQVGTTKETTNFIDHCPVTNRVFDISAFSPKKDEFVMFIKDITQREASRIELEKAYQKAEESEKLKSAFLANMSHEIRTPLNAIIGFSELLETDDLNKTDKQKCLDNIKGSGNRLLGIISDILDISKLEANQQKLNYQTANLNALIDSLFEQFTVINSKPSLRIETSKPLDKEHAFISTDAIRLQQIFSNLIENALKHTEKGVIKFGYEIIGEELNFYVKDTGSGICKKNQKLIFERFRQVRNKTGINQGTGLGIPIAAGLIQLFGGKMWLDSKENVGSTFYFSIPYKPQIQKEIDKKPTILIAEDEEANFLLLEMWMSKLYNIIRVEDGNEAVAEVAKNEDIDLVLMDVKMPYLNGIEATKKIRETNQKLPILAQTAFVMENEHNQILEAGCNEVLSKPIRRADFEQLLAKYIPELKLG